jgi:hypothetical protein
LNDHRRVSGRANHCGLEPVILSTLNSRLVRHMFRRIELIRPRDKMTFRDGTVEIFEASKLGLCPCYGPIAEAWAGKLRGPDGPIPRNAKFYFTEHGWREVGRKVVAACKKVEQEYRIIRIKECEVDVVWRDRHYDTEVAAQPRKKKRCRRA